MTRRTVDHATARRAALIAGIWVPLAIVGAAEIAVFAVGLSSGHNLIVHWGGSGADRTGPWWTYAILIAAIGLPIIAGVGFFLARATRMAGMNAWMPAVVVGVTIFHALALGVGSVVLNGSPLAPVLPIVAGFVLGVVAALITWRLLPQEAPAPSTVESAPAIPVKHGEVAAWTGRFNPPAGLILVVVGVIVALLTLDIVLQLTIGVRNIIIWIAPLILLVVVVTTSEFRIRASQAGLVVRSIVGWPAFHIPAADIARAGVIDVNPMADFGGWGLRWVVGPGGKGRVGIVNRKGEALEVVRRDGRSMVITVDDAATAAAVLETYAKKQADE
jgi:hypothetical protein